MHENTIHQINRLLKLPKSNKLNEIFKDCVTTLAFKQPNNLLCHLTKACFTTTLSPTIPTPPNNGIFRCNDSRCKLCQLYIQGCSSFTTYNGFNWQIRCHITCNSHNVVYYLKCVACNFLTTYIGKTNILRKRINVHISTCRLGGSPNQFDNHVFNCCKKNNYHSEPIFSYIRVP